MNIGAHTALSGGLNGQGPERRRSPHSNNPARVWTIDTVLNVVNGWVAPESDVYVEVANNITEAFQDAAKTSGGWQALADEHFQLGARFTHSKNTIEAAHAWLMGQPPAADGQTMSGT